MSAIEAEFAKSLKGSVKRKSNNTRDIKVDRKKAEKTAGGAPEVMAKVTGFCKTAGHAKSHIDYISRNGKVEIENERGEVLSGRSDVKAWASEWAGDMAKAQTRKDQRLTMHLVLSMPEGTDPEAVRRATREFARETFGKNHEYVFALHNDTKSPHCHLTVKTRGYDGTRLNPRKEDLQRYREGFAKEMEQQGYMAGATPRRERGVVKKPVRQEILHIEQRGTPKVTALKIKEAATEIAAEARGEAPKPKPWEQKIKQAQATVRGAWLAAAMALESAKAPEKITREEYTNERPNYATRDSKRVREGQRAAALYQSRDSNVAGQPATNTLAGLRKLPGIGMVQDKRPSEMLLHPHARNRLADEHGRAASDAVRRPGTGPDRTAGGSKPVTEANPKALTDKELAARIRGFVAAMPPVETEREQTKRQLVERFSRAKEKSQVQPVEPGKVVEPQKSVDKDLDR